MSNLPEPVPRRLPDVHPAYWRAAVSPTAVAVTAAGAGIGVLDHSVLLAVVLAAGGWLGRMGAAVIGRRRREARLRPRPAQLDPWSVPEPWRDLLRQAAAAQDRYDQAVLSLSPGPTRDRLVELQPRMWDEVRTLGELARQGAAAQGSPAGAPAASRSDLETRLGSDLRQAQTERAALGDRAPGRAAELARREEALAAQLRSLRHADGVAAALQDRLRMALARLETTVTDVVTMESAGVALRALAELAEGISTLHDALAETAGPPIDPAGS